LEKVPDEAQEAAETGQAIESAAIAGVENAPAADVAEVHTHGDEEKLAPEETVEPEVPPADESAGPEVPPGDESSGKEQ
jgi:hypothetical protein